jgi:lysophospholipase L1-like esterase
MVNPIINLSLFLILGISALFNPTPNEQGLGWEDTLQPLLDQNQSSSTITIACLGDSLTASYPYQDTDDTYPNQLQILLDTQYNEGVFKVINRGIGGHRADQILDDMQSEGWLQQDQADLVLLLAGGNDLAQGIKEVLDVEPVINQTVADMQAIVDLIKAHSNDDGSAPKVIVSAVPPNLIEGILGSLVVAAYNNALEDQLEHIDLWFTSNWDDFYDTETGNAKAELMSDTVHLNQEGYQMMAENWFDQIKSKFPQIYIPLVLH